MLGAVVFGHEQMQIAIKAIRELAAEAGKPRWDWSRPRSTMPSWPAPLKGAAEAAVDAGLQHHREDGAPRQALRDQGPGDSRTLTRRGRPEVSKEQVERRASSSSRAASCASAS